MPRWLRHSLSLIAVLAATASALGLAPAGGRPLQALGRAASSLFDAHPTQGGSVALRRRAVAGAVAFRAEPHRSAAATRSRTSSRGGVSGRLAARAPAEHAVGLAEARLAVRPTNRPGHLSPSPPPPAPTPGPAATPDAGVAPLPEPALDPGGASAGGGPIASQGPPAPEPLPPPEPEPAPEPVPLPQPEPAPTPEPEPEPPAPEPTPTPIPELPEPAPSGSPLVVGIDGGYGDWWAEEYEYRTALDAAVTRHEWGADQAVNAQDDFVLEATSRVHTRILATVGGNELGDPTHYSEWIVAFIRRYGVGGSFWSEHPGLDEGRYAITTFELGNEPYFGGMSASEYADTVRPTLEEVHRLGLPAKLILPSYIYGADTHWIDTLYQRIPNLNELFYAFADHPYWYGHDPAETGDGNSPFERIETLRAKMAEHGAADKPLFITEYGESTADCGEECVSEPVQAAHIEEMIEAAANRTAWKVEALFIYQLHDWSTDSASREEQFGLLREDGTEKPSYRIVQAALQNYRG